MQRLAFCFAHAGADGLVAFRSQDKAKVLEDVRGIISQQLGTEIEKVRRRKSVGGLRPLSILTRKRCSSGHPRGQVR